MATSKKPAKTSAKASKTKTKASAKPAMKPTAVPSAAQPASKAGEGPRFAILGQYIKDMSFECPQPPHMVANQKSSMEFNVFVDSHKVAPGQFEVVLGMRGESKTEKNHVVYLCELQYAGIFTIDGMNDEQTRTVASVECPSLLYPFARHLFASLIMEAGFRPPMLDPINFHALYQHSQQQRSA